MDHRKAYRTSFNLMSGSLGLLLLASPWMFGESGDRAVLSSAVFGGALLVRLGFSAALRFRAWKAWAELAVGFALMTMPWLLQGESLSRTSWIQAIIGLAVLGLAATTLSITKFAPRTLEPWLRCCCRTSGTRRHMEVRAC